MLSVIVVVRQIALAVAVTAAALLPLIAFNLTHIGDLHLKRLREPTLIISICLILFIMMRKRPLVYARTWFSRLRLVFADRRFFSLMSTTMLALYVVAAITQHLSFRTNAYDLSIMDEALYNSHNGRLMYTSIFGRSLLSEHFYAILVLLVPLHYFFTSPWMLVLFQPIALWASVLVLKKLLVREGVSTAVVNLACLVYLNNPIMISTLNFLFHPEVALPLLIFSMLWFYREGKLVPYWAALFLALLVKEDVGLYLLGFSAFLVFVERRPGLGLATGLISGVVVLVILNMVMPFLGAEEQYKFLHRWSHWGDNPAGILVGFARHPIDFLGALLGKRQVQLFSCLFFMPFYCRWAWLIFVIPWVINSTSNDPMQASLHFYYGLPVLTFAVISALVGFRSSMFKILTRSKLAPGLIAAVLVFNLAHFTFPYIPRERGRILREITDIPQRASLQVMSCFYPALGYDRDKTVLWPGRQFVADYIVLSGDKVLTWPFSLHDVHELIRKAVESKKYENISTVKHFFILRRFPDRNLGGSSE